MAISSPNPYPHFRIERKDSTKPAASSATDKKIREIFFEIKEAVVAQREGVSSAGPSITTVSREIVDQYSFVIDFDRPESCVLKKRGTTEQEIIDLTKEPYKEIFDTSYKTHNVAKKALPTQVASVAPKASLSSPPVASTPSAVASKVRTAAKRVSSSVSVIPPPKPESSAPGSSLASSLPAASAIDISKIPPRELADKSDEYFRGLDKASVSKLTKEQLGLIRYPALVLIRDKLTEEQKKLPAVKLKLSDIEASGAKLKPKDLTIGAIAHLDGAQICTDISAEDLGKIDRSIIQKIQNVDLPFLKDEQISAILLKLTFQQITHLLNTKDADFLSKIGIDRLDKTFIQKIPQGTLNQLSDEVLKSIKSELSFSQRMDLPPEKKETIGFQVTRVSPLRSGRLDAGVVVPSSITPFRPSSDKSTLAQRALTAPRIRLVSQSPKKTFWDKAKSKWENLKTKLPWRKTSEATSVAVTQANPAWYRPTHQREKAVEDGVQLQDLRAPRPTSTATPLTRARISRINPLVIVQQSKDSPAIAPMSLASSAEAVAEETRPVLAGWPNVEGVPVEEISITSPLMGRTIPLSLPAQTAVTPVSELDKPILPVSPRSPTSGRIPTSDYISELESGNIQAIGVDQIESISLARLKGLSKENVHKFTKAQLEAMTETQREAIKDNLSAQQRGWLGYTPVDIQASVLKATEGRAAFSPTFAGGTISARRSDSIEQLTPDLIKAMDQKAVQSLTRGKLNQMKIVQLNALKKEKNQLLSEDQKSIIDALIASKSKR